MTAVVTEVFPARVRRSGTSKVVTIPEAIANKFELGETVYVEISKDAEHEARSRYPRSARAQGPIESVATKHRD